MHRNSSKIGIVEQTTANIVNKEREREEEDQILFISFKDNISTNECKIY